MVKSLLEHISKKNVLIYCEEATVLCHPGGDGALPLPAAPVFHSFGTGLCVLRPHLTPLLRVRELKVPRVVSLQPPCPSLAWQPQAWERHESTAAGRFTPR